MATEAGDQQQIEYLTKLAQQQDEQIETLVNLLLAILRNEPDAHNRAENVIFIQTTLYEYIAIEGEEARAIVAQLAEARGEMLRQEATINKLKRVIIEMELDTRQVGGLRKAITKVDEMIDDIRGGRDE